MLQQLLLRRLRWQPRSVRVARRLTLLAGLALAGIAAGAVGTAAFDGADIRRARAALGGEGLAPVFELFAAWVGTIQKAKSPLDFLVPELVEGALQRDLRKSAADRELRYLGWLDRFAASDQVSPEIRRTVVAVCWDQRAVAPIACHGCAHQVLDQMAESELRKQEAAEWLLGASALALALLGAWQTRALLRARAGRSGSAGC